MSASPALRGFTSVMRFNALRIALQVLAQSDTRRVWADGRPDDHFFRLDAKIESELATLHYY